MKTTRHSRTFPNVLLVGVLALSLFTGCATQNAATSQARTKLGTIPEFHPELGLGALQGYLDPKALPNSLALIPPPPAPGSTAFALDVEIAQNTFRFARHPALRAGGFRLRSETAALCRRLFPARSTSRSRRRTPRICIICCVARSATSACPPTPRRTTTSARGRSSRMANPSPCRKREPFWRRILPIRRGTPPSVGGLPSS